MHMRPAIACAGLLTGALVALTGTTAQAVTTRYEAETAPAVCTGTIDSDWTGYSGSGFCNATNASGAYAQFTVNAASAGTATLNIRFANGSATARPATVAVNGTTAATASFETTGTWDGWTTKTLTVPVKAGGNTVRLTPTTSDGLPNLDHLEADVATAAAGSVLYVSPTGTDGAAGTESAPTTLTSAISRITPAARSTCAAGPTASPPRSPSRPAATAPPPPAPPCPPTRARSRSWTSRRRRRARPTGASNCSPTTGGCTASRSSTPVTTASTSAAATTSPSGW